MVRYEPETGEFYWLVEGPRHGGRRYPGDSVTGTQNVHGYKIIGLDKRRYPAHRLAWFYVHGAWPKGEVDHINHDILDNRLANLRDAPERTLQRGNQKRRKDNTSGFKGVIRNNKRGKPWLALCKGKRLGVFDTPEEAHAAYMAEARRVFGDFAFSG